MVCQEGFYSQIGWKERVVAVDIEPVLDFGSGCTLQVLIPLRLIVAFHFHPAAIKQLIFIRQSFSQFLYTSLMKRF
jgi:hypothetical protein